MNLIKGFAVVTCLAMPLPVIVATAAAAETATTPPASSDTMMKKSAMSDADKRAKAADCSKQADAKGLHGEARKKFREACKTGK